MYGVYSIHTYHTSRWNRKMDEQPPKKPRLTQTQIKIREGIREQCEASGEPLPWDDSLEEENTRLKVPTPWEDKTPKERVNEIIRPLQKARKEAELQAGWFRDRLFDTWVKGYLIDADSPRKWTRSTELYEHYVAYSALKFADRKNSILAQSTIATHTHWGAIMATKYPKTRRPSGWFYPVYLNPKPITPK